MDPLFLSLDEVIAIHRDELERHGGTAGVRDNGLLQSAIAMPMAGFGDQLLHADIYAMAAAYLFHLVMNHPFLDGKKRVGAMTAYVFLDINGIELTANDDAYSELVLAVTRGEADKAQIALFIKDNSRPAGEDVG